MVRGVGALIPDVEHVPEWLQRNPFFGINQDWWRACQHLFNETPWQQQTVTIYGRETPLPRLTAWYGVRGTTYTYSGISNKPLDWTPLLGYLRGQVQLQTRGSFNSCLLNLYRGGRDSVSWHADDEPELGEFPVIASVSLGATRTFSMKHRYEPGVRRRWQLGHGDLLVMRGNCQQDWLHSVPKTAKDVGPRINLTFRYVR